MANNDNHPKIQLSPFTFPYSSNCSSTTFTNGYLHPQEISPSLFSSFAVSIPLDFIEERTPATTDFNFCSIPGFQNDTFELMVCLNRFGGAIVVDSTDPTNIRQVYKEECVGYDNFYNDSPIFEWTDSSVLFFPGLPQDAVSIETGPCYSSQAEQEYTIAADPIECGGVYPCSELRKYVCMPSVSTVYPEDPSCVVPEEVPFSLFRVNRYCSIDADRSLTRLKYGFCATDASAIRLKPLEVNFCENDVDYLRYLIDEIYYCGINYGDLRPEVERVLFCSLDTIFLREESIIEKVTFCSLDPVVLNGSIEKIEFCEMGPIISKVKFCNTRRELLDGATEVKYCDSPIVVSVHYCSAGV